MHSCTFTVCAFDAKIVWLNNFTALTNTVSCVDCVSATRLTPWTAGAATTVDSYVNTEM